MPRDVGKAGAMRAWLRRMNPVARYVEKVSHMTLDELFVEQEKNFRYLEWALIVFAIAMGFVIAGGVALLLAQFAR